MQEETMKRTLQIWLDDERPAPRGWHLCRWPIEVINMIKTGMVKAISLDHDLGDDARGTGYDVLLWIEQTLYEDNKFRPPGIEIHTQNISARQKMRSAVAQICKRYIDNQKNLRK